MKVTMDSAGRIVIPKEIRVATGLSGGGTVEIEERNGVIELSPVYAPTRVVKRGRVAVIEYENDVPPLLPDVVEKVLDDVRKRR